MIDASTRNSAEPVKVRVVNPNFYRSGGVTVGIRDPLLRNQQTRYQAMLRKLRVW
jgi:hypothetical protein